MQHPQPVEAHLSQVMPLLLKGRIVGGAFDGAQVLVDLSGARPAVFVKAEPTRYPPAK